MLGRIPLGQLEPDHVTRLMNDKLEAGLSARTVTYIVAVLRAALGEALRTGKVARNVAAIVRKPKIDPHRLSRSTSSRHVPFSPRRKAIGSRPQFRPWCTAACASARRLVYDGKTSSSIMVAFG